MTAHNFIGPYCHGCGLFTSAAATPGAETCELVIAAREEREALILADAKAFCATHPDGIYWVEYESGLTVAALVAANAPYVWYPLDADEVERYHGLGIDSVTVIEGPIPPPAGHTYDR